MPTNAAAVAFEAVLATGNVEAITAVLQAFKATAPAEEAPADDQKLKTAIDKKAKAKAKDPNAPKRAVGAYQAFFAVEMVKLRAETAKNGYPVKTKEENTALMQECGRRWKALSDQKKNRWANSAILRNENEGRKRPNATEGASTSASASEDDGNESD